ncbi:MAG: MFS transporter [Candidatus Heimdallarchaeota archaeon]
MFVKQSIDKLLGTAELPAEAQSIFRTFLIVRFIISLTFGLASTFFILYTIDAIGFAAAAVATSFMLLIRLLFDYPCGSLGDWIGQRWVLTLAYLSFGVAIFLTVTADTIPEFMLVALFNGFGGAQSSGAIETWIDNNYKKGAGADVDPDRKIYGFGMQRVNSLNMLANGTSFLTGGTLATVVSRPFVFQLQSVLVGLLIICVLILVKDLPEESSEESSEAEKTLTYFTYLKGGIAFLFSSKTAFFFLMGSAIYSVHVMVWARLILFPLYFGYTGNDAGASLLRTLIYFFGIFIGFYITAKLSTRFSERKLPLFMYGHTIAFFSIWLLVLHIVPGNNEFNIIGFVLTIVIMNTMIGINFDLGNILRQRVTLDLIPSEYRNSVYSLIPSLISIVGIPLLPIAGRLVEDNGLSAGILMIAMIAFAGTSLIVLALRFQQPAPQSVSLDVEIEENPVTG